MRIKTLIIGAILLLSSMATYAQTQILGQSLNPNVITTAVPFVSIAPDARGGSLGDCGVSSDADVYSMHYNPAKYSYLEDDMVFGLGYSPWLYRLVPDMHLAYLAFATKLNSESAIGATLRYFSCGDIMFRNDNGDELGEYKPNEWALDATYSRMLTDYLSGAVAGRFIYSNLTQGVTDGSTVGWSVAADVAVYYKRPVEWFRDMDADIAWGISINNIGSKISYNSETINNKYFIPTTLRFGPSLKLDIDEYNSLTFMADVTKLLVPTPPLYKRGPNNEFIVDESGNLVIEEGKSDDVSVMVGLIQSFYDAPGFSYNDYGEKVGLGKFYEELCEYNIGLGVEYWYNDVFAVRAGYFNETALKGNRKYVTLGAALKYNVFGLDVSYLVPVNGTVGTNPLESTLRFDLTYSLGTRKQN
ncbi:MAG: type IX secretion system outer membrane channel protein PorV [Bacteroidales bacterium]|nr:type IX secretion system outer membrane channel protein PorV [Bacteroidales bacterium]